MADDTYSDNLSKNNAKDEINPLRLAYLEIEEPLRTIAYAADALRLMSQGLERENYEGGGIWLLSTLIHDNSEAIRDTLYGATGRAA